MQTELAQVKMTTNEARGVRVQRGGACAKTGMPDLPAAAAHDRSV